MKQQEVVLQRLAAEVLQMEREGKNPGFIAVQDNVVENTPIKKQDETKQQDAIEKNEIKERGIAPHIAPGIKGITLRPIDGQSEKSDNENSDNKTNDMINISKMEASKDEKVTKNSNFDIGKLIFSNEDIYRAIKG